MNTILWEYLRKAKSTVPGWLQRVDAEIIGAILAHQARHEISGSCVEIGVHHGKSFIPLCLDLRADELALCIDIFEDQGKNLDNSGKGDLEKFRANLERFAVDSSRVRIFKGSSEAVSSDYILEQVGPVRFFSVDGGHWRSIVENDLGLAERTLAERGVIALDDYCRAEWPEVTHGYAMWQQATNSGIVPFASGSNKLYLCRKEHAEAYRAALKTPFLKRYFGKTYKGEHDAVDCYRVELIRQDEELKKNAFLLALKIFRPDLFPRAKAYFRRFESLQKKLRL